MIDVYIAKLPENELNEPLSCAERQIDIDKISNERVRRERYYVWRLLEYAIKNSLGADASRLYFTKGENKRWFCKDVEFSLSHSDNVVAVAIFNPCNNAEKQLVGVDIEKISIKNVEKMANFVLTPSERNSFEGVNNAEREEWLIRRWCEKEAIFKSLDESAFAPKKIETSETFCNSRKIEICGKKYIFAVAAKKADEIRIFNDMNCLEI